MASIPCLHPYITRSGTVTQLGSGGGKLRLEDSASIWTLIIVTVRVVADTLDCGHVATVPHARATQRTDALQRAGDLGKGAELV